MQFKKIDENLGFYKIKGPGFYYDNPNHILKNKQITDRIHKKK